METNRFNIVEHSDQDIAWLIICSTLILLMQAGFCCLESGSVRKKNITNVAIKNFSDFCLSGFIFFLFGFGLMFGLSQGGWFGTDGFLLGENPSSWDQVFFIFELMFCGTAVTIVSGAIAERTKFLAYLGISIIVSGLIFPLFGHWAWKGVTHSDSYGWLFNLGFIDFAGSTVVHSLGGWVALAVLLIIGPRSGRYLKNIKTSSYNMALVSLGVFLLWIGWFGFNGGGTFKLTSDTPKILINTLLSGISGGLAVMVISWRINKKPQAEHILNGVLAGLVGITASCNVVSNISALIIGTVAGVIYLFLVRLFDRFKLDDVVYAFPVHTGAGVWGTLAVAIFGNPMAWEAGRSRWEQFGIQSLGIGVCFLWAFGVGFLLLWILNKIYPLRVSFKEERIGLDVSEHSYEELQAKILRDETLIAATVEGIKDGIITIDSEGMIESLNPEAESMFGYSSSEAIGKNLDELISPTRGKDSSGITEKIIGSQTMTFGEINMQEVFGKHKNGSWFNIEIRTNLMDLEGHPLYLCLVRNITEHKLFLAELEQHKNQLELLVKERTNSLERTNNLLQKESSFIELHKDLAIIANESASAKDAIKASLKEVCQFMGWSVGHYYDISDENPSLLVSSKIWHLENPELFQEFIKVTEDTKFKKGEGLPGRVLENCKPSWIMDIEKDDNFLRRNLSKNLNVRTAFAFPINLESKVLGVMEFFSSEPKEPDQRLLEVMESLGSQLGWAVERKKTLEQIMKAKFTSEIAQAEAEKANLAKSEFLARMSHELRTPMNAILGFTQLMIMDPNSKLGDNQKLNLERVSSAGKHLLELINDVLDLSRIESGGMSLSLEVTDMIPIVDNVISFSQTLADEMGVSLRYKEIPSDPCYVEVDSLRFKQVVLNLISNSIKYNKPNGSVIVSFENQGNNMRLGIKDTGIGLSPEKINNIFKPFNRLGIDPDQIEGTGIGLTISKQLIELMGGSIGVDSVPEEGSFFYIDIPISSKVPPESKKLLSPDLRPSSINSTRENVILYIEDIQANIDLLQQILLGKPNLNLISATNAIDGIKIAKEKRPDLILMDIHLPEMDGLTAFGKLKNDPRTSSIPVIALTADAMDADIKLAMNMGFRSYITKPIDVPSFLNEIDNLFKDE